MEIHCIGFGSSICSKNLEEILEGIDNETRVEKDSVQNQLGKRSSTLIKSTNFVLGWNDMVIKFDSHQAEIPKHRPKTTLLVMLETRYPLGVQEQWDEEYSQILFTSNVWKCPISLKGQHLQHYRAP